MLLKGSTGRGGGEAKDGGRYIAYYLEPFKLWEVRILTDGGVMCTPADGPFHYGSYTRCLRKIAELEAGPMGIKIG